MYTQANKLSIASLYGKALKSDEKELEEYDFDSELAESFGHYLAMMALSHGVSWFDNHKKFDLVIPRSESHAYMHRGQWFYST